MIPITAPSRRPWLGQVHGLSILSHNLREHIDFRLSVTHLFAVSELRVLIRDFS
jgi:hypothetical protein